MAAITPSIRCRNLRRPSWRSLSSLTVMRGLQKPWTHLCCCGVYANVFLNVCLQAEVKVVQIWCLWEPKAFGTKAHVGVWQVLHSLCSVCQRSILLEAVIWFLSNLLDPWKNFCLQNFFVIGKGYNGDLTLGGAESEEVKSLRIFGLTLTLSWRFRLICEKLYRRQPVFLVSCAGQECYLIVHVCLRDVSMNMFCSSWSTVPPCGYRLGVSFKFAGYCCLQCVRVVWGWHLSFGAQKKGQYLEFGQQYLSQSRPHLHEYLPPLTATRITELQLLFVS